jgi:hypothetical protein
MRYDMSFDARIIVSIDTLMESLVIGSPRSAAACTGLSAASIPIRNFYGYHPTVPLSVEDAVCLLCRKRNAKNMQMRVEKSIRDSSDGA